MNPPIPKAPGPAPHIRIALVEDDAPYRRKLSALIEAQPGWRCVAACADAAEARRQIPGLQPDLVLIDIRLPAKSGADDKSGIRLVTDLRACLPAAKLIMMTVVDAARDIVAALQNGASGYLLKGQMPEEIVSALGQFLAGGANMSPAVAREITAWLQRQPRMQHDLLNLLTPREREVVQLISEGKTDKEIAGSLGIAADTVANHVAKVFAKLNVRNRAHLMARLYGEARP